MFVITVIEHDIALMLQIMWLNDVLGIFGWGL
jgi:hypothetical protein